MTAPECAPLGAALALLMALVALTGAHSPTLVAVAVAVIGALVGIAWPALLELLRNPWADSVAARLDPEFASQTLRTVVTEILTLLRSLQP